MRFFRSRPAWLTPPVLADAGILAGLFGVGCAAVLSFSGPSLPFPWDIAGGSGTPADPYLLSDCKQLQHIGNVPAAFYAIEHDIDCSKTGSGRGFFPIGSPKGFTGTLDGRHHAVRGVVIRRPEMDGIGLIRTLGRGAQVTHLVLDISVEGRDGVGGLAGWSLGAVVEDVTVRGSVKGRKTVGGIVGGQEEGTLRDVSVDAQISGSALVGGIVGYNAESGVIENAQMAGTIEGTTNVGGIAGVNRGAAITGCTVSGIVRAEANAGNTVGWMLGGQNRSSAVSPCVLSGIAASGASLPPIGKQGIVKDALSPPVLQP